MAEYSFVPVQTIDVDENVTFMDGDRACRKGFVSHRSNSGIFFLKGSNNGCKAVYRVTFNANIAVSEGDGGVVGPISVAITINGEALGNATGTVVPAAAGDPFNVSLVTFVDIPCGCCVTVGVENVSDNDSSIDVTNANIIFDRVA